MDMLDTSRLAEEAPWPRTDCRVGTTWHRNLAAAAVVAEAERYAAGERWITVVTGDLESAADAERLRALHAGIEAAVAAADYTGYERISGRNDRTTWCWWATPAAKLVRAARVAADRLNPGWWQIEADDY
jgi:hypothetical protein